MSRYGTLKRAMGWFVLVFLSSASPTLIDRSFNASIVSYEWEFDYGNPTTVTEPTANHTFTMPGKYNVTLKVTDEDSRYDTTSEIVTIYYMVDLNRDEKADILDIFRVAMAFESKPGDENWNEIADLNKDEVINILDIFGSERLR